MIWGVMAKTLPVPDEMEEFRAILGAVRSGMELLQGEIPHPNRRQISLMTGLHEALSSADSLLATLLQSTAPEEAMRAPLRACDLLHHTEEARRHVDGMLKDRSITTTMAVAPLLQNVTGNPSRVGFLLVTFLDYLIRVGNEGSAIAVSLQEVALRQGRGVEWKATVPASAFTERDRYRLFDLLGNNAGVEAKGDQGLRATDDLFTRLRRCRAVVASMHGELWAERSHDGAVALVLTLPAVESLPTAAQTQRCKLDIAIRNYAVVQDAMGSSGAGRVLHRIEHVARDIVRRPRDAIMIIEPRGIVSVMFAAPATAVSPITDRLRFALDAAKLTGRHNIALDLDYHVTHVA
jgi:hypothetical protein